MRGLAVAVALLLAALPAAAQVLYKWTDAAGKVFYSDRPPPKGFTGKVERIEPDIPATPIDRIPVEPRAAPAPRGEAPAPNDVAARRRATRESLQARVDTARAKVEAARKALADSADMTSEDRHTFVQRVDGPPNQVLAMRSTCSVMKDAATGKNVTTCATSTPSEAYRERVEKLEEALRVAEDELSDAQAAYRRGVD